MKDLPKQIRCGIVEKTITGRASCSSNKQIHSKSVERSNTGEVSCNSNNVQLEICSNEQDCTKNSLFKYKYLFSNSFGLSLIVFNNLSGFIRKCFIVLSCA